MKFISIRPSTKTLDIFDAESFEAALVYCGLKTGEIDIGNLGKNYSIAVYEFGLLEELNQGYFTLNGFLYAGNALVFAIDDTGATVSVTPADLALVSTSCAFYETALQVEAEIVAGLVHRPQSSVGGVVHWQWTPKPTQAPEDIVKERVDIALGAALKKEKSNDNESSA